MDTSNMVFVFGSNTGGIHGAGAARFALEQRGARMGVGYGHVSQSFAIPTKGVHRHKRRGQTTVKVGDTLDLMMIKRYVDDFIRYAQSHQDLNFQVTCIGCGLAGLRHEDIAPMFRQHSPNCYFDLLWQEHLPAGSRYWGTF